MAMVSRPYACPSCRESFTKWGLCQNHVRASAPCRSALEDKLDDIEGLQEICRTAAGTVVPAASQTTVVEPQGDVQALSNGGGFAAAAVTAYQVATDGMADDSRSPNMQQRVITVAPAIARRFDKAVQNGFLTEGERFDLEDKFEDLADHPHETQLAAVSKFFSATPGRLRWVQDKGSWLLRCLRFCARTGSGPTPHGNSTALISALAHHALLPDAISKECWDIYLELPRAIQEHVVTAVRGSIPVNLTGKFTDHFENLCTNEQIIAELEELPPPRLHPPPPPQEMDAIDGTQYQKLLQQFLMLQRNCEERLLKELADADPDVQPGDEGSLFHTHMATQAARMNGTAEVLSLLHAASANGLARAAARFIAEGLDVNEKSGHEGVTPLHCAAAKGEVDVVEMLLKEEADPNIQDDQGHTALYVAVREAADAKISIHEMGGAKTFNDSQTRKLLTLLMNAGADNLPEGEHSPETLAEVHELHSLRNIMRVHMRIRKLQDRFDIEDGTVAELLKLQYETAAFTLGLFERHVQVNNDAASAELTALVASDYIQDRDKVQRMGNRLANRLSIGKKALDVLVDLPSDAGLHVIQTWKIEETVPGIYEVPDHLNLPPRPDPSPATNSSHGNVGGDGLAQDSSEAGKALEGVGIPEGQLVPGEAAKLQGRVRKWDSERGFGFIVQDTKEGEEAIKDIFVHRTNVVGSSPANHIDLKQDCRASYRLGEQDGRLRALEVTMIDGNGKPLAIHLGNRAYDMDMAGNSNNDDRHDDDNDIDDEGDFTHSFIRYMRTREVQEIVRSKRIEAESWLRCVGLRRLNIKRRDDSVMKKEIDRRVDILVEKGTTPLQKRDFDFRVRRFLLEHCVHSTVTRVSELLAMVETSTVGKSRDEVRSWPAYLATLLRRFDPKLYEVLADRDRRSRVEQRKQRPGSDGYYPGHSPSVSRPTDDLKQLEDDDDDDVEAGDVSPPPDYSDGSIEDPSTGDGSSLQSTPRDQGGHYTVAPALPPGPPPPPQGQASPAFEPPLRRVFQ